jgi:hypothetical protein
MYIFRYEFGAAGHVEDKCNALQCPPIELLFVFLFGSEFGAAGQNKQRSAKIPTLFRLISGSSDIRLRTLGLSTRGKCGGPYLPAAL